MVKIRPKKQQIKFIIELQHPQKLHPTPQIKESCVNFYSFIIRRK
jgi:hypothetical protein